MLAEAALALGVWLQLAAGQEAPGRGECLQIRTPKALLGGNRAQIVLLP